MDEDEYDCRSVPYDKRLKHMDPALPIDEESKDFKNPNIYRGFEKLPNLETKEGRAIFYKNEDRGVTKKENPSGVRVCSEDFIDSLFEDYQMAFEEDLLSAYHKAQAKRVFDATELEFDRLQWAPELFPSAEDKSEYQDRLVDTFMLYKRTKKRITECRDAMIALEEDARQNVKQYHRLTYVPGLPDWSQFLMNGAPGAPKPKNEIPIVREQVAPPAAMALVGRWNRESQGIKDRLNLIEPMPPLEPGPSPLIDRVTSMVVRPSPFTYASGTVDHNDDQVLTLPEVNRVVADCMGEQVRRVGVDDFRDGFPCVRVQRITREGYDHIHRQA